MPILPGNGRREDAGTQSRVRTNETGHRGLRPKGAQVVDHVRRAAGHRRARGDLDDGDRRLRRDAPHFAPDELVENEVADNEDTGARESRQNPF